jgi:hypothetical protein
MLRKVAIAATAAALGWGAALGLAACGEDREGEVEFQTGGTETTATGGTETAPTETAPTETAPTETAP